MSNEQAIKLKSLFELCDRRHQAKGSSGTIHFADHLNPEELHELLGYLRSMPFKQASGSSESSSELIKSISN